MAFHQRQSLAEANSNSTRLEKVDQLAHGVADRITHQRSFSVTWGSRGRPLATEQPIHRKLAFWEFDDEARPVEMCCV